MNVPGTEINKPNAEVVGQDSNAFVTLGICKKSLRKANVPDKVIEEFVSKAQSGDYDNLLNVCSEYCNLTGSDSSDRDFMVDDDDYDDDDGICGDCGEEIWENSCAC